MVINLVFANNTILSFLFFFSLISDLYFLIPAVITQIFTAGKELAIPREIQTQQAKVEMETNAVTVEAKISKCSVEFKIL